jgi:hypothetical protein
VASGYDDADTEYDDRLPCPPLRCWELEGYLL